MPHRLITRSLMAAALVAATLSGCGKASVTTIAPDESFTALDLNGDGRLTLAESLLTPAVFAELDINHDGALSLLEWQGAHSDPGLPGAIQDRVEADRQTTRPAGPGTW